MANPQGSPEFSAPLTERERRDVITPYAFQVDPRLLGLPLAQPWRRALAIAIDGVAIGFLSQVPKSLLVVAIAVVMFRWAGKTQHSKAARRRGSLRAAAVALFLLALIVLMTSFRIDDSGIHVATHETAGKLLKSAQIARLVIDIDSGKCRDLACARGPVLNFAALAGREKRLSDADAWSAATAIIEDLQLSDADNAQLHEEFLRTLQTSRHDAGPALSAPPLPPVPGSTPEPPGKTRQAVHSVIEWVRGLLDDLGIGLGWAALYFTVFSAWWNGQTPGKKLLGIRVVQLDGTPITLWEAFERCGGYGAGLATGLLGFMQVWWDPNRQAIHDKIAETVVIRVNRGQTAIG